METQAIEMISNLYFLNTTKNDQRKTDGYFSGECDIYLPDQIRDIKCVYELDTFPLTHAEADKKAKSAGYDLQGQVYMHLFDRDIFCLDFILLPTPQELCFGEEQYKMQNEIVQRIPAEKRVRTVTYKRDKAIIETLKEQVEKGQKVYHDILKELRDLGN